MPTTPGEAAKPAHEPSRVWTIALPPQVAVHARVALVHVCATQMGEVIITLINTDGHVGAMHYGIEGAPLAHAKALCDRFSVALWPLVVEWLGAHAQVPWGYLSSSKAQRALRERYLTGRDPGPLRTRVGDTDEAEAPDEAAADPAEAAAETPAPPAIDCTPDFVDREGVAHFDRARREAIEAYRALHPRAGVVAWSRYGADDERVFQAAKARALAARTTEQEG